MIIELIGIVATVIILISMLFTTTTVKGSIYMRSLNILGSLIFIVYGFLLPAVSTATLNAMLTVINVYHLIKLIKDRD